MRMVLISDEWRGPPTLRSFHQPSPQFVFCRSFTSREEQAATEHVSSVQLDCKEKRNFIRASTLHHRCIISEIDLDHPNQALRGLS